MDKTELRKTYLARQRQLSHIEHLEKSERIADGFFQNFGLKNVRCLHCFLPIEKNREIDTWQIFQKIWRDFPFIATVMARVDFDKTTLETIVFSPDAKLVFNRWRILEPADGEKIDHEKIDVVLVPLLAFDRAGFRVGYGRGFYDRFLSECRPDVLKIGLSYFPPVERISDVADFDVKLDFCVTPDAVIGFAGERQ